LCTFTLNGAKDAYEFSLVAVPAQRAAGVTKSYTGKTVYEGNEVEPEVDTTDNADKATELALRARLSAVKAQNIK